MKNKETTRWYSDKHEKSVCKAINAVQQSNSGAGNFKKGDVVNKSASLLVECKCKEKECSSFSVKKEWLDKNDEEAFSMRIQNTSLCFNYGPDSKNYYVISEKLMKFLVEKLEEENNE